MNPEFEFEQRGQASAELEVTLFDGWDHTPVRFPQIRAPKPMPPADLVLPEDAEAP